MVSFTNIFDKEVKIMKRILTTLAFLLLMASSSLACNLDSYNSYKWGITQNKVLNLHGDKIKANRVKDLILYDIKFMGYSTWERYMFFKDQLYNFGYMIDAGKDSIQVYENLFNMLGKKYGSKDSYSKIWVGNTPLYGFSDYDAIKSGLLDYLAIWQCGKTQITLTLMSASQSMYVTVSYTSKALVEAQKADKNKINKGVYNKL